MGKDAFTDAEGFSDESFDDLAEQSSKWDLGQEDPYVDPCPTNFDRAVIARAVASDISLLRHSVVDSTGGHLEVHNAAPPDLPQLRESLNYVKQRLSDMYIANGLASRALEVEYIQQVVAPQESSGQTLSLGYQLILKTWLIEEPADIDPESIQASAIECARDLLFNRTRSPRDCDDAFDETQSSEATLFLSDQAKVAHQIHAGLKNKKISCPFEFTASDQSVTFEGRFAGDEASFSDEAAEPTAFEGYIQTVEYRGTTKLVLDVSSFSRTSKAPQKMIIEFDWQHKHDVHRLAIDDQMSVMVWVNSRTESKADGRRATTHTLARIIRAGLYDLSDEGIFETPNLGDDAF